MIAQGPARIVKGLDLRAVHIGEGQREDGKARPLPQQDHHRFKVVRFNDLFAGHIPIKALFRRYGIAIVLDLHFDKAFLPHVLNADAVPDRPGMEQRDHHLRVIAAKGQPLKAGQFVLLMNVGQEEVHLSFPEFLQTRGELQHFQLDLTVRIGCEQIGDERQYQSLPGQRREDADDDALPCVSSVAADVADCLFKIQNDTPEPLRCIFPQRRQHSAAPCPNKEPAAELGFQHVDLFRQPLRRNKKLLRRHREILQLRGLEKITNALIHGSTPPQHAHVLQKQFTPPGAFCKALFSDTPSEAA